MERLKLNTLILGDEDLDCSGNKEVTLKELSIAHIGFISSDIEKFDLVIYSGKKGKKVLKSKYF